MHKQQFNVVIKCFESVKNAFAIYELINHTYDQIIQIQTINKMINIIVNQNVIIIHFF